MAIGLDPTQAFASGGLGGDKGAYWVGQDGQVYVKGDRGVNASGPADANTNAYWQTQGYNLISDPATETLGSSTSTAPTNPAGTNAPDAPIFNDAGARNTQGTIDQMPGLLKAALGTEKTRYDNSVSDFAAQETEQRGQYKEGSDTNQLNYDANFMDSIRSGVKGLGGLMALLRGTGASGGTAQDQVKDVVGGVTANDIRGGADTRNENQSALDTGLGGYLGDLKRKRETNTDTYENNQRAVNRDSNTQLQDLYQTMAGYYGDVGNQATSDQWTNKAGGLTPSIAADSRTQLSSYDSSPVKVQAPELTDFKAPTQSNVLAAPGEGQVQGGRVGSGIFSISDRRKEEERRRTTAGA
jgi:hypothetical protein